MQCPVCNVTLLISSRESIEIDHCPQCRGVWLDRGELDKIIERAAPAVAGAVGPSPASAPAPPPPREREYREYRQPRDDEDDRRYQHKRKRRGSFLEDLFDFD
jgi:Zn-finger nucleic acid-binding protein